MKDLDRWRTDDPCEEVGDLARSFPDGIWLNLLVTNMAEAVDFQTQVFGAEAVYSDENFAIMRYGASYWLLHADKTYQGHPTHDPAVSAITRGAGCEIRLQGCDPDEAARRAEAFGCQILEAARNKPHALREAFIAGPNGYVWVPCIFCDID